MQLPSRETLEYAIAVGTLAGLIWAFWKWVLPILIAVVKRAAAVRDVIEGLPSTLHNVTAMKSELEKIGSCTNLMQKMIMPNGGSSLPDKMDRLQQAFDDRTVVIESIRKDITGIAHMHKARLNVDRDTACFEADPYGRVIEASITKTFTRWVGMQTNEIAGWGWINIIHPEDVTVTRAAYMSAIQDCRALIIRFSMIMHDGLAREVELHLTPVPDGANPCEKFFGAITRIEGND